MGLTAEEVNRIEELKRLLLRENGDKQTMFGFEFTERELFALATGYVPKALRAAFVNALDWHEDDKRRGTYNRAEHAKRRRPKAPSQ